jgi:hypothetical protein
MINYQKLKDDMSSNPKGFDLSGTDRQIAEMYNEKKYTVKVPIPINVFLGFCADSGILDSLNTAKTNPNKHVRSAAMAALEIIRSPHAEPIDSDSIMVERMIKAFKEASILTDQDERAFYKLAETIGSYAEVLFGPSTYLTRADLAKTRTI